MPERKIPRRPPGARARARTVRVPARKTIGLATARAIAQELRRRLEFRPLRPLRPAKGPGAVRAASHLVGSARRGAPRSADVDLVVVVPPGRALSELALRGRGRAALGRASGGERHRIVAARWGSRRVTLDIFATAARELPFALFHWTGPAAYNVRTRALARRRGWRLNQYGLFDAAGRRVGRARTERDVARLLGVSWRRPEDR